MNWKRYIEWDSRSHLSILRIVKCIVVLGLSGCHHYYLGRPLIKGPYTRNKDQTPSSSSTLNKHCILGSLGIRSWADTRKRRAASIKICAATFEVSQRRRVGSDGVLGKLWATWIFENHEPFRYNQHQWKACCFSFAITTSLTAVPQTHSSTQVLGYHRVIVWITLPLCETTLPQTLSQNAFWKIISF